MSRKKSDFEKRLTGNPGKGKIGGPAYSASPDGPIMPLWLTARAMVVFNRCVDAMPPGYFSVADSELLAAYATACDLAATASADVARQGAIVIGSEGAPKRNPNTSVWADATRTMTSLGRRLGFDPAARSTLKVDMDPVAENNGFGDLIGGGFVPTVIEGDKTD